MMTVEKLINELSKYDKNLHVYAYEGEITGLIIKDSKGRRGHGGIIECPQD